MPNLIAGQHESAKMAVVSGRLVAFPSVLPVTFCTKLTTISSEKGQYFAPRYWRGGIETSGIVENLARGVRRRNTEVLVKGRFRLFHLKRGNCQNRVRIGATVAYAVGDEEKVGTVKCAADETLEMLGWPSLCNAVAGYASTAMGKQRCHAFTQPSTEDESEALLDETFAGLEIDGLLGGVFDFGVIQTLLVKASLDRVSRGIVISGQELGATATLLEVASKLQRGISTLLENQQKSRQDMLRPIAMLVEPILVHQDLCKLIWSKIDEDGLVKDSASSQLRQARIEVHLLEQKLQQLLNKLIRDKSEAEDAQDVIDIDGRLCLTLRSVESKANIISGLQFQHGGTGYLEPSQAVSLNNKLAEARAEVQKAEHAVLSEVSSRLLPHTSDIYFVLETIVRLDVVAARGKYSSSIGGRKPLFTKKCHVTESNLPGDGNIGDDLYGNQDLRLLINLRKFRHPLLIDQHYWALRKAKAKLKEVKKSFGRMRSRVNSTITSLESMEAAVAEAEREVTAEEENVPVPIDVHIVRNTRVVAITGPNTGGKTAAIKAVGLAALMAKVGLYVPAMEPVRIPWFDAVLADIGDEQSLSQSLSTFSGHLLRIKRIMAESTQKSLVLLDELGAGTDPTEGAALGMALLESFANGGALLTLATTHHGELKTLKYSDERFENVSVEFDEERLAPTYKLLWGIPGRSNALNIARRLGLPDEILVSAQELYGTASAELNEIILTLEGAKIEFDRNWKQSENLAAEIKELYAQLVEAAESVYEHQIALQSEKSEQLATIATSARSRLSSISRKQRTRFSQPVKPDVALPNTQSAPKMGNVPEMAMPNIGQLVYVPKLGRHGKVVEINTARKEITVQCGLLPIIFSLKDVQRGIETNKS